MNVVKKKVVLITTGGTIASTRNKKHKLESGKLDGQAILSMCQLENEMDIEL
ncbi:MAG: asparaginase domain-containing protein, partial [Solibacillus isronensis]